MGRQGRPFTSDCLVDLNHAKRGKSSSEQEIAQPVDDNLNNVVQLWCSMKGMDMDVARQALVFFPATDNDNDKSQGCLAHVLRFRPLNGQLCTPQHLGWQSVKMPYSFEFHPNERWEGSRTGTPPYTSAEVLSNERYFDHQDIVFHDAVHDVESFLWVLIHVCITQQGPGGVRREELEQKNEANEAYNSLRRVVYFLFDSNMGTMAANKREIFKHPKEFEQFVLVNFHSYFLPLRDLVKEWFHLLLLAHKFHAFEYRNIHDMVLEILDHALERLVLLHRRCLTSEKPILRNCQMAIPSERFNNLHLRIHHRRVKDKYLS